MVVTTARLPELGHGEAPVGLGARGDRVGHDVHRVALGQQVECRHQHAHVGFDAGQEELACAVAASRVRNASTPRQENATFSTAWTSAEGCP